MAHRIQKAWPFRRLTVNIHLTYDNTINGINRIPHRVDVWIFCLVWLCSLACLCFRIDHDCIARISVHFLSLSNNANQIIALLSHYDYRGRQFMGAKLLKLHLYLETYKSKADFLSNNSKNMEIIPTCDCSPVLAGYKSYVSLPLSNHTTHNSWLLGGGGGWWRHNVSISLLKCFTNKSHAS